MDKRRIAPIVALVLAGCLTYAPMAEANAQAGRIFGKFMRGFVNVVTGWVEIPKRAYETAKDRGAAAGLTWGILRGIGHGLVRTAAGAYEIISFPIPAPPDYAPIIFPEYIFIEGPSYSGSEY